MYKCNSKDCMYYNLIKKNGKYKGFCDYNNQFFEEMSPQMILEREENCTDQKAKPTSTKV